MFKRASSAVVVCLGFLVVDPTAGRAQSNAEPLTEADVLGQAGALEPAARAALTAARLRGARAGIGLAPNPRIGWERQQTFDPNAQSQDVIQLALPIDLSGRRRAARALADADLSLAEAGEAVGTLDASALALQRFYEVLALQRQVDVRVQSLEVLAEAERVVQARESAGDAAGYEGMRLRLERRRADSRLGQLRATLQARSVELSRQLGLPERPFGGDFDVDAPTLDAALSKARLERPELAALESFRGHAERAARAARTAWLPTFELTAGYNRQFAPAGHGYTIGAEITLPFFDHGQGEAGEARGAAAASEQWTLAVGRQVDAAVRGRHAELQALLETRARFAEGAAEEADVLVRAVLAAYREGEQRLIEWLDARRAAIEIADRAIELDLAVRLADVALRAAMGTL